MNFETLRVFFFPSYYRTFEHKRLLMSLLRAGHIVCFTLLVGGVFFNQHTQQLSLWVSGTVITGILMFALELYPSCIAIFEVRCLSVLFKIFILMLIPLVDEASRIYLLLFIIIFSSLISHASRRIKHATIATESFREQYGFSEEKK